MTDTAVGLPGRIFIVRHGERLDHVTPHWYRDLFTDRAHDSPLTDAGRQQGSLFGRHVWRRTAANSGHPPDVTPTGDAGFTILTSPLVRCVDTAQHIARELGVTRLLVEPALIEVGWYMHDALARAASAKRMPDVVVPFCRGVVQGNAEMRSDTVAESAATTLEVRIRGELPAAVVPREGLHLTRRQLHEHVSRLVDTAYAGLLPHELAVAQCQDTGSISRPADGAKACCENAAKRCTECLWKAVASGVVEGPACEWLRGSQHTLILVGHGDSIYAWFKALTHRWSQPFPAPFEFNCASELRLGSDDFGRPVYQAVGEYFGTGHLRAVAPTRNKVHRPTEGEEDDECALGDDAVAAALKAAED